MYCLDALVVTWKASTRVADLDFSKGGELYISACDVNSGCEEGTTIT